MFMVSHSSNGTVVHAYKHQDTRRYLNLDEDGKCYAYDSGYFPIPDEEAFAHVYG